MRLKISRYRSYKNRPDYETRAYAVPGPPLIRGQGDDLAYNTCMRPSMQQDYPQYFPDPETERMQARTLPRGTLNHNSQTLGRVQKPSMDSQATFPRRSLHNPKYGDDYEKPNC